MKIKKLKNFKNIFSNWAKNAESEFYTALERRRGVWTTSFALVNEEQKFLNIYL